MEDEKKTFRVFVQWKEEVVWEDSISVEAEDEQADNENRHQGRGQGGGKARQEMDDNHGQGDHNDCQRSGRSGDHTRAAADAGGNQSDHEGRIQAHQWFDTGHKGKRNGLGHEGQRHCKTGQNIVADRRYFTRVKFKHRLLYAKQSRAPPRRGVTGGIWEHQSAVGVVMRRAGWRAF